MSDHIFERDGNVYRPTEWAGSPWSEGHQHGGPINALFATAAEEASLQTGLRVVRLTVDLFRSVPRVPLVLEWRFVRQGRRIAVIEAELTLPDSGEVISRASSVLLAPNKDTPSSWQHTPAPPLDLAGTEPVEFMPRQVRESFPPGFHWSFEVRMGADEHGPAAWITTPLDLLPAQPMSPLQRCAAVADLTFGLSGRSLLRQRIVDVDAWRVPMINVDTTIYWERPPVGHWFGFRHALLTDHEGIGLAEVDLADADGRLGRSLQAMLSNDPPKLRAPETGD
ncbi:MAG: thioesterase family protein [Deltaproteobacteria bacterium]|nr:thioesterase family protein [Deltaproteobacteria bacterium]MBW2725469.1 thioesterase family protein [Deltaproteobacteria bacterium]